jgi:hypothetical protein
MELLNVVFETTSDEACTQAKEQIGQDGSQDCSLENRHIAVTLGSLEQNHEQYEFDNGATGCLHHDSDGLVGHLARELLSRETEKVGGG